MEIRNLLLQFPGSKSQKTNDDHIVYILTTEELGAVDVKQIHVCLFVVVLREKSLGSVVEARATESILDELIEPSIINSEVDVGYTVGATDVYIQLPEQLGILSSELVFGDEVLVLHLLEAVGSPLLTLLVLHAWPPVATPRVPLCRLAQGPGRWYTRSTSLQRLNAQEQRLDLVVS